MGWPGYEARSYSWKHRRKFWQLGPKSPLKKILADLNLGVVDQAAKFNSPPDFPAIHGNSVPLVQVLI